MLSQFFFSNFKSYRSETTFDFQAEAIPEFEKSLITEAKATPLLPVSVIYGLNGGGKTTLLEALFCLISTVVRPVFELGNNRVNPVIQQEVEIRPFLFDGVPREKPTEFNIFSG